MNTPELPGEPIVRMLHDHDLGVLATYGGEYPYTSLISLEVAADGHSLIFPTARQTRKYATLQHEARVSVLLDNRAAVEKEPQTAYALTVLGSAHEVEADFRPGLQASFFNSTRTWRSF